MVAKAPVRKAARERPLLGRLSRWQTDADDAHIYFGRVPEAQRPGDPGHVDDVDLDDECHQAQDANDDHKKGPD